MLKGTSIDIKDVAKKAEVNPIIAALLIHRDIKDPIAIKKFLYGTIKDLHPAHLMKDMNKAVSILLDAIQNKKKICIYGDYDVDGVMSTFILYKAINRCGGDVFYHIPDREDEGYGMNSERVKIIKELGCDVILTCDNGIAAMEQVKLAKELGMTVIVTDHHDVPFIEEEEIKKYVVPPADAVINPKQKDCAYPFKLLCGGGIAFKLVQCLYEQMGIDRDECEEYIQYAAIATICDVVDLVDENRIIAKYGLSMLNKTENIGLKALINECALEDKSITVYHIGFIIGPCINATGRLETAKLSVKLLLAEDYEKAKELARKLKELNIERQNITSQGVERAERIIENNHMDKDKVLVIYDEETHESVAGIVAGRIKEKYNLPTIILTKGKDMPKGSARSIDEYNMFEELSKCKDLLDKFGGHPMAAGLSLSFENIDKLRQRLNENCKLTEEELIPKIRIDQRLPLKYVSFKLVDDIKSLEPFGKGNPSPLFAEKDIIIERVYVLGKEKNVFKLLIRPEESYNKINGLFFDSTGYFKETFLRVYDEVSYEKFLEGVLGDIRADIIYYPDINEYNGTITLQLVIKDIRFSTN